MDIFYKLLFIAICVGATLLIFWANEVIPGVNEPGNYRKLKEQGK